MAKPLLNYCLVTQNLASIIEDSAYDLDRYPDVSDISGEVIFTPNIANGKAYQLFDSEGKTYTVPVSRIQAKIINGVITHEDDIGIYLFAAGPGSNPDKITYSVEYRNLRSGELSFSLSPLKFEAIPGGEVDLTLATPVVGAIPAGTTKGDKGDTGDPGPQGERGPQGGRGPQGERGPQGDVSVEQLNAKVPITILTGVGSPEGNVSAPVGSIYTDSETTNGAIRWIKTSGTGSTGWKVEYGDTGLRDISDLLKDATGSVTISRIGQVVYLEARVIKPEETLGSGSSFLASLPVGFRPATRRDFTLNATLSSSTTRSGFQFTSGAIGVWQPSTSDIYYFQHHWVTSNSWPTSLPGTPA